jgi:hypothetical protein
MLIKGTALTPKQRAEVLAAFGYRWTSDNQRRAAAWHGQAGRPTIPLVTDREWLAEHAFHFIVDGSRLDARRRHAEPAFVADN